MSGTPEPDSPFYSGEKTGAFPVASGDAAYPPKVEDPNVQTQEAGPPTQQPEPPPPEPPPPLEPSAKAKAEMEAGKKAVEARKAKEQQ